MAKGLSAAKAKKMLEDGRVRGTALTEKQKKLFGAVAGGATPLKAINGGWLDKYQTGGSLPGASGMMYSRNSGSSAMSPPNLTKAQDGTVEYGTPEYKKAYEEGTFADVPNQLDEVVISGYNRNKLSPSERNLYNMFYKNSDVLNPNFKREEYAGKDNPRLIPGKEFTPQIDYNGYEITPKDLFRLHKEAGSPTVSNEPSWLAQLSPTQMRIEDGSNYFRAHADPLLNKMYIPPLEGAKGMDKYIAEIAHLHPDFNFTPTVSGTLDRIKRGIKERQFPDSSNYTSKEDFEHKTHSIAEDNILDYYFPNQKRDDWERILDLNRTPQMIEEAKVERLREKMDKRGITKYKGYQEGGSLPQAQDGLPFGIKSQSFSDVYVPNIQWAENVQGLEWAKDKQQGMNVSGVNLSKDFNLGKNTSLSVSNPAFVHAKPMVDGTQFGEANKFFPLDPKVTLRYRFNEGGSLPKAQNGNFGGVNTDIRDTSGEPIYDIVNPGDPNYDAKYRETYNAGAFASMPNPLDEVVIDSGVDYEKDIYYDTLTEQEKDLYHNDYGPIGTAVRRKAQTKKGLAEDTYDVVNPLMYGMLGVAGGMMAAPSIATLGRAAAGPIGRALSYKPFGGPVSIGNTIDAGSAAYAAYATPEAYDKFKENPSWDTGLDLGLTAIDLVPFSEIFTGGKNIRKAYNYASDKVSTLFRGIPQNANIPTGINLETTPLRDAVTQPNIWPTSSPLPENMEPYVSKKIYPFNKEQEVFESFLSTDKQLKNIDSKSLYYDQAGKPITKSEADNLLYPPEYQKNGGEIDKAQWGLIKWGKNLYDGFKGADKAIDAVKIINKSGLDISNLGGTSKDIANVAKKIKDRLMTDKFITNNMNATGRTRQQVVESIENFTSEFNTGSITFEDFEKNLGGIYYGDGNIGINTNLKAAGKDDVLGTIDHEVNHLFSDSKGSYVLVDGKLQKQPLYDNYPSLKITTDPSANIAGGSLYQSVAPEQQVRQRKAIAWLEENAGLEMGGDITEEMVEKLGIGLKEGEIKFAKRNTNGRWTAPPDEGGKFEYEFLEGDYKSGVEGGGQLQNGKYNDIGELLNNINDQSIVPPGSFSTVPTTPVGSKRWIKAVTNTLNKTYTVGAVGGLGAASQMIGPTQADGQFKEGGSLPKAQYGLNEKFALPFRDGVLNIEDDQGKVIGESSHIMKTETDGKGNWFSFPTLFQDEDGTWVDMSEQAKQKWEPVYEEAKKRGEVIDFGTDEKGALEFGEGSWKSKMKHGGGVPKAQFGWLNKLYKMYKGTDKVVDAASTTGKLKYMDELSSKAKKDVYEQNYEALTKTDKETRNLGKPHIAQEEYGEGWKYSDQVDFNNPEEVAAHRKRWIASQKKGNLINDNRRFPFSDETSDIFSDLSRKDLSGSIRDGLSKRFGTIGNTYTTGYGHRGLDYETNYLNDYFKNYKVGLPDGSTVPYGKLDGSVEIDPSSFNSSDEVMEELRRLAQIRMGDQFNNAFEKTSRIDFGDLLKNKNRNGGWLSKYENGGVIEDDRGQWAHPGEITKINSNNITMKGVNYPVLGISDTGDTKMMQPGVDNYKYDGNSVTEYPMAKDGKSLVELDQLTNFTNYNTPQPGGWLDKY